MKVKIGISNRHVHLTKEVYQKLFNKPLRVRNYLNQIGEFASTDTVTLENNGKKIENVRIVGPFRDECQIELANSDLDYLGIKAPVRRSGQLSNTPGINILNDNKKIHLEKGVIRAERHVHVPENKENLFNLHEREIVEIKKGNLKFYANVKVSKNGFFEVHIDKDDAKEFNLKSGEEVELTKCGKSEILE